VFTNASEYYNLLLLIKKKERNMEKFTDDQLQYCMNCHYLSFDWVEDDNITNENEEGEYNERLCPRCNSEAYFTATSKEIKEGATWKNLL
jgi:uncharacterized paraquat-inducible protein A